MTRQRQVILEELQRTRRHPTAAELYQKVRKRIPKLSLGTVYRNLELLHDQGIIRKLSHSGKEARFDSDLSNHYHVRCKRCGRIDDLTNPPKLQVGRRVPKQDGWQIDDHRVEFVGLCPDCRGD